MRFASIAAAASLVALLAATPVAAVGHATMVKDINPAGGSNPSGLVAIGNRLYFVADDGKHGRELWRSDGTQSSTALVADVRLGRAGSNPEVLGGANDVVFFSANDGLHGRELWRSDGSSQGTQIVKSITAAGAGTQFGEAAMLGDRLFFVANDNLWVTKGTAASTRRIGPSARAFVPFADKMFFLSGRLPYDQRVWKSDGTAAGTGQVGWSPVEVNELAATASALFMLSGFQTPMQNTLPTLWKSDGTRAGTVRLTARFELDQAYGLVTTPSQAFFFDENYDPDETAELWRTKGTASRTRPLAIVPIPAETSTAVGNSVMFVGFNAGAWQIWKSDGTASGTSSVDSFAAGVQPSEMTAVNGILCFYTYDYDADQWTLWEIGVSSGEAQPVLTGAPAAQHPLRLTAAGANLFFALDDGVGGSELWRYAP